jgi:F0F1-type ATP synthase alpha subunit
MSTILEDIETQIAGLKTSTSKSNVGVVRDTGDGVARIEGLSDVMLNEMIEFSSGVVGLALNLEETEVGAIILGDTTRVMEGDEARTTGKLLQVPWVRRCSVAWLTRSASRSMARAQSVPKRRIRSRRLRRASSSAGA